MSSKDIAIRAKDIHKAFFSSIDTARNKLLLQLISGGHLGKKTDVSESNHVLSKLNLEIKKGEKRIIYGLPSSGKSVLCRIIAGQTLPDKGDVSVSGRVRVIRNKIPLARPLNSLENYLKACIALHGFPPHHWLTKLDQYAPHLLINNRLKTKIRDLDPTILEQVTQLVLLILPADIFLIDDGKSCYFPELMSSLLAEKTVVTFLNPLREPWLIGKKASVLHGGAIFLEGEPDFCRHFTTLMESKLIAEEEGNPPEQTDSYLSYNNSCGLKRARITNFAAVNANASSEEILPYTPVKLCVSYQLITDLAPKETLRCCVAFLNHQKQRIFSTDMLTINKAFETPPKEGTIEFLLPGVPLLPGDYRINLSLHIDNELADKSTQAFQVTIGFSNFFGSGKLPSIDSGSVIVPFSVSLEPSESQK